MTTDEKRAKAEAMLLGITLLQVDTGCCSTAMLADGLRAVVEVLGDPANHAAFGRYATAALAGRLKAELEARRSPLAEVAPTVN